MADRAAATALRRVTALKFIQLSCARTEPKEDPAGSKPTDGTAQIGVTGLAVMGRTSHETSPGTAYTVAAQPVGRQDRRAAGRTRIRRQLRPQRDHRRVRRGPAETRRVLIMVKAGGRPTPSSRNSPRCLEPGDIIIDGGNALYTDTHPPRRRCATAGCTSSAPASPAARRARSTGRRSCPAVRRVLPDPRPAARGDLRPRRRRAVLHPHRPRRRRALRQDGTTASSTPTCSSSARPTSCCATAWATRPARSPRCSPRWNKGDLDSFLVEITAEVLNQIDAKTGRPLVDLILDEAEQKGTGRWTVSRRSTSGAGHRHRRGGVRPGAERLGAAAPRRAGHGVRSPGSKAHRRKDFHRRRAQGAVRLEDRRLRAGLSARSRPARPNTTGTSPRRPGDHLARRLHHPGQVPQPDQDAFDENPDLPTLIAAPYFRAAIEDSIDSWRRVVVTATELGIPNPGSARRCLLRRPAHRAAARRADAGAARPVRRAHLRPHRHRPAKRFHTLWSGDHTEVEM